MIGGIDTAPLWLSFRLAALTTALLLPIGIALAYFLASSQSRLKPLWETLVSMPLVLPPSVLGFYLLLALSPQHAFGHWLEQYLHLKLVFSFSGLVLGSLIFSLPFMVQPLQAGLQNLPASLLEASRSLGKSDFYTLWRILLPNIKPAVLTGVVLSFAHTVGEFGVVLMIGGNIPGVSKVASLAIYDEVESLNYAAAHTYAAVLLVLSFSILLGVYLLNRRSLAARMWP
ncbi:MULTISPECIES: molybdate ABC transporter permease subunit [unclassified Undibacterium]|uniref:molybdate ABC transporter permease subunit n=1 Tax=unclassified Undibacterium TaxID=2630295 RepID=UPI002AC93137|nr:MULTISPECIES: molybdate ABC transporter permease subunit [unclassified Undibacterium]MEB0137746.1 molybdate ABC transporter permease subunit [Undibacterium sp. CCC2.1]MEB0172812.1 molybdate ABC transporter permease subunit [Undibacterium sp. CCC1.1]MEB0176714.1 molybdate ABC transporter permease subunit [Undibacterium sp. CCC3.4]MEB0215960.1 molybdate ABC transporter permease subunit [Undibacterium sp. 5I2]WPX42321.1 molybdate ABC transporter permease subunit [Undibacterium sp. CCC3.4]